MEYSRSESSFEESADLVRKKALRENKMNRLSFRAKNLDLLRGNSRAVDVESYKPILDDNNNFIGLNPHEFKISKAGVQAALGKFLQSEFR